MTRKKETGLSELLLRKELKKISSLREEKQLRSKVATTASIDIQSSYYNIRDD